MGMQGQKKHEMVKNNYVERIVLSFLQKNKSVKMLKIAKKTVH